MEQPLTALDQRFSDPGAVATEWETTRRGLESAEVFWISTVRPDGRPHVSPLVAVWLDNALHFCTGTAEQKALNLAHNPHVLLTTGCNQWEEGLDIVVEGDAVRVRDEEALVRLATAWATKWDGRWRWDTSGGQFHHRGSTEAIPVFTVAPAKVLAFAKGTFSHTSYRFDRST
jgi:nitroimidazol reductase NimA-like FMN-containing flavoprotein (pyridoxamine 5'-phosphate oxidase superfamily)